MQIIVSMPWKMGEISRSALRLSRISESVMKKFCSTERVGTRACRIVEAGAESEPARGLTEWLGELKGWLEVLSNLRDSVEQVKKLGRAWTKLCS